MPHDTPHAPLLETRLLSAADAKLLLAAGDAVFDHAARPQETAAFLADPAHHMVGAIENGELIGFASAVVYLHPDKAPQFWINELAVAEHRQSAGVGKRILQCLLDHARALGHAEAWLATEGDNIRARALYRTLGAEETEDIVMATFDLRSSTTKISAEAGS